MFGIPLVGFQLNRFPYRKKKASVFSRGREQINGSLVACYLIRGDPVPTMDSELMPVSRSLLEPMIFLMGQCQSIESPNPLEKRVQKERLSPELGTQTPLWSVRFLRRNRSLNLAGHGIQAGRVVPEKHWLNEVLVN